MLAEVNETGLIHIRQTFYRNLLRILQKVFTHNVMSSQNTQIYFKYKLTQVIQRFKKNYEDSEYEKPK
jgi:hypothetical protein